MDDLKDMQEALRATFLYATSDSLEALTMAEQLAVLDRGALVEADGVERIYHEPHWLRSAELIGFPRCNILSGTANGRQCETVLGSVALDVAEPLEGDDVALALRPEHVTLASPGMPDRAGDGAIHGSGRILLMENLGAECVVHIELRRGDLAATLVGTPPSDLVSGLAVGDAFPFRIRPERIVAFGRASGLKLGIGRAVAYA
jgi:ABC-type sugar transport system ATPase subunit